MRFYLARLALGVSSLVLVSACEKGTQGDPGPSPGTGSEIVANILGGVSNDWGTDAEYGVMPFSPRRPLIEKLENFLQLFPNAWAYSTLCRTGGLNPPYRAGGGIFQWTPPSCTFTFGFRKNNTVSWTGAYTLNYSAACSGGGGGSLMLQPTGCRVTRTTPSGGVRRHQDNLDRGPMTVVIDTAVPGGFRPSIATSSQGEAITCTADQCTTRTVSIAGTHITSSSIPWDQTISTDSEQPIVIVGHRSEKRVKAAKVIIQHNGAGYTSVTTVATELEYSQPSCCFPTKGALLTTFSGGRNDGFSERLVFHSDCGESTLIEPNGRHRPLTLPHCI